MGWEMVPALIGGANAINSGIKGKNAAKEANQRQAQMDQHNSQFLNQGMSIMGDMQNRADSFLNGTTGEAARLADQARTGGAAFSGQMNNIAGQLMGNTPTFDFTQGSNIMDQSMAAFDQYATGARNSAREQAGAGMTAGGNALDAALAGRGISRNSGVAAGAMGDMAMQGAQQMVGLERDLSNQAAQSGLQATQFDVNRVLQEQGMGSQFALGSAAQRGQNLGMAGDMYGQAYTTPLAMQQQLYQQNQLNPYMQMQSMMNPMDLISMAMGGMQGATSTAGANAATGGAGMGSGMAGLTGQMWDYLSNKNQGGGGSVGGSNTYP